MKAAIDGLERYAINRNPSSLVCDGCGKKVRFEDFHSEIEACKAEGWEINSTWHGRYSKEDYCPKCVKERCSE